MCNTEKKNLSFCEVNAHHQNGKSENIIKDVTTLLHSDHCWPNAIHAFLWLSAIKNYVNLKNSIPTNFKPETYHGRNNLSATYESSLLSIFSGSNIEANLDHFHTFGYPDYVLDNSLQSGKSHNKCINRSRVGIYLSHLIHHASNVPLVLNTQTGNFSPQFHCFYDNAFVAFKREANFK